MASSLAIAAAIAASLSSAFCPVAAMMSSMVTSEISAAGSLETPHRLRFARLLQQRAHLTRIGPVFRLRAALDPRPQPGLEAIGQIELLPGRHALEDFGQFVRIVGRKLDGLAEAAAQAGIAVDEAAHFVAIAGDDHDDAVAIVFHELQQRIDRFLAEIVTVAVPRGEAVGLVDEQDAVERLAAFVQCLGGGLPDIPGDQAGAVGLDDMPLRSTFSPRKISPTRRATSVLPTPGGPVNTMCWLSAETSRPWSRRFCSTCMRATSLLHFLL